MARERNDSQVVVWVPVHTKAWLEKEAARRGLGTSTYLRTVFLQMESRAAAA